MTWFRKDDQWPNHPKVRRAGLHGRALWDAAGPMCAARNSDGLVEPIVVKDACYLAECDEAIAVPALIAAGLWHDHKTIRKCAPCKRAAGKLEPGAFYYHDWLDYQLTKDVAKIPEERLVWRKRKAVSRNTELREATMERDRGLCRYCGIRVNFRDKVSPRRGQRDHVDPDGPETLDNIVIACGPCNEAKGHRTPAEAGMTLWPPGTTRDEILAATQRPGPDLAGARSDPAPTQPEPGSDSTLTREGWTGQVGAGSEPGPGQLGDESVPGQLGDGSVPGRGQGRDRSGPSAQPPTSPTSEEDPDVR